MFKSKGLETLKLKPDEHEVVTTYLKQTERRHERRRAARCYRLANPAGLVLHVQHPGGTSVPYRIAPRDLSEVGMGFLYGNFLYPGSACRFDLRDGQGQIVTITGKIARCDHVTGRVHDVGMAFDAPADLERCPEIVAQPLTEPTVEPRKERPAYWLKK